MKILSNIFSWSHRITQWMKESFILYHGEKKTQKYKWKSPFLLTMKRNSENWVQKGCGLVIQFYVFVSHIHGEFRDAVSYWWMVNGIDEWWMVREGSVNGAWRDGGNFDERPETMIFEYFPVCNKM